MSDYKLGELIWQGLWLTLPIEPWFNTTTKQVYSNHLFKMMQRSNTTFRQLHTMLNEYVEARNKIFGVKCHNSEYYLVKENKRFAFLINCNTITEQGKRNGLTNDFSLWDDFSQSLGSYVINPDEVPSNEFIQWLDKTTGDYCKGIVKCSECGKEIDKLDIAGRYFAGIYCEHCWNTKWKAIEAKENYN